MNRLLIGVSAIIPIALCGFLLVHLLSGSQISARACASKVPQPRIVAFGDSLVAGYGASTPGGFVSLVSSAITVPIANAGKNGDTTAQGLDRISDVESLKPTITILLLGGNDALQQVSHAETEENLGKIIDSLKKNNSRVILLGVLGGIPDPYASMYARLAKEYSVTYVPNVLSGIIGHSDLVSDSVHPNQIGYQKIADRVAPVVEAECGKL